MLIVISRRFIIMARHPYISCMHGKSWDRRDTHAILIMLPATANSILVSRDRHLDVHLAVHVERDDESRHEVVRPDRSDGINHLLVAQELVQAVEHLLRHLHVQRHCIREQHRGAQLGRERRAPPLALERRRQPDFAQVRCRESRLAPLGLVLDPESVTGQPAA